MENLEEKKQEAPDEGNPQTPDELSEKERRYKEQLAWSKSEAERLRKMVIEAEVQKASQNADSLLELHSKDPKLANEVAKEFGYSSFDDAKQKISADESQESNKWLTEDDFEIMYQSRKQKEEHEKALKKVEKVIAKLDDEKKEKAQAYFDKISDWKLLDEETSLEFAEMATLYVNKDKIKNDKLQDWIAMLWSTWLWNSKKSSNNEDKYVVRDWKLVLLSND